MIRTWDYLSKIFSLKNVDSQPTDLEKSLQNADGKLRQDIFEILENYYLKNQRSQKFLSTNIDSIRLDGHPDYIDEMMLRDVPHDADYTIFRYFQNCDELILDIGANWGYSVGSMLAVGVKSKILSFEAIPLYKECLKRIADKHPEQYEYKLLALSSESGKLKFVVPVVNGVAISALTSASLNPQIKSLAKNIHDHIHQWMYIKDDIEFSLCEFEVPVYKLDDVISDQNFIWNETKIAAMKLDVEGLEFDILRGAKNILDTHKPLVMSEGANRQNGIQDYMEALGYLFAERNGDRLQVTSGEGTHANGFFVHEDNLEVYGNLGIL